MERRFAWLPTLLLLRAAAFAADDPCPMNTYRPAPENAYQVNDVLWAGQPVKPYPRSAYRLLQGIGYVLCTCETETCIRKCCPPNAEYVNSRCTPLNVSDHLLFKRGSLSIVETFMNESQIQIVYDKVYDEEYELDPLENCHNFQVNNTGFLLSESGKIIAEPDRFCVEQSNHKIVAIFRQNQKKDITIFYRIGIVLSLPFLFSTFLVYALIKDLRNLHGKSLMCHIASLLVAYISLIFVQFIPDSIDTTWCVFLAYTVQFTFLASFFWLNVMCFDLWWTFSGFRPLRENIQGNEAKKFIIYSIYAWGSSSLISIITFSMEEFPYLPSGVIRPAFGTTRCWFGYLATLLYFYGPIGTLLCINLLMFIYTAIEIVKRMKDAEVFRGSESRRNVDHEKQRFVLYLKLFIVMGVNWLAEVISWATNAAGPKFVWYVADMGNVLQGVLIFLIFVCKKRVLHLLRKKFFP